VYLKAWQIGSAETLGCGGVALPTDLREKPGAPPEASLLKKSFFKDANPK
jgi:hypothetical protein